MTQFTADLHHIDWIKDDPKVEGTESQSGTNVPVLEAEADMKGVGNLYGGMEVVIDVGSLKMHHGVVKGTREKDGRIMIDVLTSTLLVNTMVSLDAESVRERL